MEFRLPLTVKPFPEKINLRDPIMLTGSCFTDHIARRLKQNGFRVFENPSGILFNPASIGRCLVDCMDGRQFTREDLFETDGVWQSFDFHSRFAHTDPEIALDMMNNSFKDAHRFLRDAKWVILTLGSAWAYHLPDGRVAANCHKVPAPHFDRRLLSQEEMLTGMDTLIHRLRHLNPGIKILFTISPVRHIREGFVENNRSKAALISIVHHSVDKYEGLYYFPAYELVIDDLRDYRFFAEDMVHPNYLATEYVWEKFSTSLLDDESLVIMESLNKLNAAKAHRPQLPASPAHKAFLQKQLAIARELARRHPWLDLTGQIEYFSGTDDGTTG